MPCAMQYSKFPMTESGWVKSTTTSAPLRDSSSKESSRPIVATSSRSSLASTPSTTACPTRPLAPSTPTLIVIFYLLLFAFYVGINLLYPTSVASCAAIVRTLRIYIASIFVDDVKKAHDFYVDKLGFVVKDSVKNGDFWWLTITIPDGGTELLLEPNAHLSAVADTEDIRKLD